MKTLCFILCLFFAVPAHAAGDPLVGYWQVEDRDAVVSFYPCEDSFCGRFVWLKKDSAQNPSLDDGNTNPNQRGRPLCGMNFLGGFEKEGEGVYKSGWLYSPRHGSSFGAELRLEDENTLVLRGYFLFSFLGGEQTWKRVSKPSLCWKIRTADK